MKTSLISAAIMPFAPIVSADSGKHSSEKSKSRKVRPSQLPIYEEPEDIFNFEYQCDERSMMEEGIGTMRQEIQGAYEATQSIRDQATHIYDTGIAHSSATLDYIQDEENILPRLGVISLGGLAGLLLGARKKGGLFKKIIYSSAGLAGSASLCYPKEATQITETLTNYAQVYGTVGYNFIAGVKPQSKTDNDETSPDVMPSPEEKKEADTTSETPCTSPPSDSEPETSAPPESPEASPDATSQPEKIEGDVGQGNPADVDMYTTRGN